MVKKIKAFNRKEKMGFCLIASLAIVLLGFFISPALGETLTVQLFSGLVYNFRTPLVIHQDGESGIRVNDAKYDTKALDPPIYWAARVGWWKENGAWELELVHHKLFLENGPSEVQHFSISHGFNLLTVNHAWKNPWFIWRLGAGAVITHPESTIREKTFGQSGGFYDGYYLSGPTGQVAIEKRFYLWKGLFASIEGKMTASWARVPVVDGHAELWNGALHGLLGLGYDF